MKKILGILTASAALATHLTVFEWVVR